MRRLPAGAGLGDAAEHLVAFLRGDNVLVAVSRWTFTLEETGWGTTTLDLPTGTWIDRSPERGTRDRSPRASCSPRCRSHCWSGPMAEFAVWALPERVRLDVEGALHPMTRGDDGWWRAEVDCPPDTRYGFVLDDDPTVLPDPARRQPDGVHERSQLWDTRRAEWTDAGWRGAPWKGAVVLRIVHRTFTPEGTFDAAIGKLDHLEELGVDFVEIMPVNAFNGTHGWGYDGVLWFAVHEPTAAPTAWSG